MILHIIGLKNRNLHGRNSCCFSKLDFNSCTNFSTKIRCEAPEKNHTFCGNCPQKSDFKCVLGCIILDGTRCIETERTYQRENSHSYISIDIENIIFSFQNDHVIKVPVMKLEHPETYCILFYKNRTL